MAKSKLETPNRPLNFWKADQIFHHLPQINEWEKEQQQQRWNNKPGMDDLEKNFNINNRSHDPKTLQISYFKHSILFLYMLFFSNDWTHMALGSVHSYIELFWAKQLTTVKRNFSKTYIDFHSFRNRWNFKKNEF